MPMPQKKDHEGYEGYCMDLKTGFFKNPKGNRILKRFPPHLCRH
jgi:hypothetical protein